MNTATLNQWMNHPIALGKDAGAQLEEVLHNYPWFQTAHLLYIKSLHNDNSFLYNQQLRVAAAHAINRKKLYELITSKETNTPSAVVAEPVVTAQNEIKSVEPVQEEIAQTPVEPAIPFVHKSNLLSNSEEWEAGMLRQLQLLHHWRNHPTPTTPALPEQTSKPASEVIEDTKQQEEVVPTAADEINTLLYVLLEPDGAEDIGTLETVNETSSTITDEIQEEHSWDIRYTQPVVTEQVVEEETTSAPGAVPDDPIEQSIITSAINNSILLEVQDELPVELPVSKELIIEETTPIIDQVPLPETVKLEVESSDFAGWLKQLDATKEEVTPNKEPQIKPALPEQLIERFIQEEPRIKPTKTSFYNPVNMAKKSVQESDDFVTETLARIYAKQGNFPKAIRTYQKLSLKYPEKSTYFAALIEELKRTPNKNTSK
jgi:hypothetical protein